MHRSFIPILSAALLGLTLFGGQAQADAPLKTALGLDVEQARQVADIQSGYRREYAAVRGRHNTEARKLRRARIANDSEQIADASKADADFDTTPAEETRKESS